MRVLGIETSCDETSLAVIEDGEVRVNAVYTQKEHADFGGVVPEIASRAHLKKIDRLFAQVMHDTGLTPQSCDLIAVTDSPGLAGALLVGISFAMGLSTGYSIPVTGVNHLEGHIAAVMLEHPGLDFPFIALVVSGGHTAIYRVNGFGEYEKLGTTVDDAAGEAFDKVGKMLGFSYPAGREIEETAARFTGSDTIDFPVGTIAGKPMHFSFSGLKTAVKYYLEQHEPEFIKESTPRICASFQRAVLRSLVEKTVNATRISGISRVALVGGVACNGALRRAMQETFGTQVFVPSPGLCTDNGAMIAKAGLEQFTNHTVRFPKMDPSGRM